ncbi:hypothetical protein ASPZODRAFT_92105 [Penicilliopsis zonata CBS 506.65]|uniref:3-keto-steroid reductase n=1 Tax=Penicilliopsis zonata CBS 506.65 TaxID=1073090 RepID=A0A1L9SQC9_9EURO|nr:hypothetical protein ASPZODRAFT_92105 [Penicilliopsis zonata CBS 506.65]OJJ49430.1 hypothetical protein ASPZODRAFT_92105 [Penicilliopsis zonata CBS 506.65]
MMSAEPRHGGLQDQTFVLVTGANSGVGFSICCRLADEFLATHPPTQSLTVIFTTRSTKKGNETITRLHEYLRRSSKSSSPIADRVTFVSENVDLTDLVSVRALSRRLVASMPKLDAIILNAGSGGFTGVNWPQTIWGVCTDLVHALSWPWYKLSEVGVLTKPQIQQSKEGQDEPPLGFVFCSNVFGHYMLAHNVMPLLRRSGAPNGPGRVVWVSSLEATIEHFDIDDIQGLRSSFTYQSSKALTDLLALTSDLPSTAPWVNKFLAIDDNPVTSNKEREKEEPKVYLSHPGICATAIMPLALPLVYAMLLAFWMARLLGSPWHTLSTYLGAASSVWLALSPQADIDAAEEPYRMHGGGRPKWGSACDWIGRSRIASTEIEGWGYAGVVGEPVVERDRVQRRKRGATTLTPEAKEHFEELGRRCWREMEELRVQWDEILDREEGS